MEFEPKKSARFLRQVSVKISTDAGKEKKT